MKWLTTTKAERRAAADTVRLFSGDLSEKEQTRMCGWSDRQSEYGEHLHETWQLLAEMDGLADDPKLQSIAEEKQRSLSGNTSEYRTRNNPVKLALAAVVVAAVALGFWNNWFQAEETASGNILRYVTRVGEQKTIDLSDGSQVTLNTSSVLLVDYSENTRRLVLERGEVFFEVAKDKTRPFSVELGSRSVTALGTAFNVYLLPESFTLAVTEGVVAMHRKEEAVLPSSPELQVAGEEPTLLANPGQMRVTAGTVVEYEIDKQQLVAHQPADIGDFQDWRTRLIRFDSVPLYQVVKELNRYSAKKILIEDDAIMNLDIAATVHLDHMNEALDVFERAMPIEVLHRFDRIVIQGKQ